MSPQRTPRPAEPRVAMDDVRPGVLVVCEGGPNVGQAFWAEDLATRQRSAARTRSPATPADALRVLFYRATSRTREIRVARGDYRQATVVEFRPVMEVAG